MMEASMTPLAYHLIWTTYGSWLPGDVRGWIQLGVYGVQPPDPQREQRAREMMAEEEVILTREQRDIVEQAIRDHCRVRGWLLHTVNARSNHVHVVVTPDCDGEAARDQFKMWASRRLSDAAGLTKQVARKAGRRHWWTESGDAPAIWDERYLENAIEYVTNMQGD
jgi:REP element-mobilizing transposase RayT